jgi:hypothetical protein
LKTEEKREKESNKQTNKQNKTTKRQAKQRQYHESDESELQQCKQRSATRVSAHQIFQKHVVEAASSQNQSRAHHKRVHHANTPWIKNELLNLQTRNNFKSSNASVHILNFGFIMLVLASPISACALF